MDDHFESKTVKSCFQPTSTGYILRRAFFASSSFRNEDTRMLPLVITCPRIAFKITPCWETKGSHCISLMLLSVCVSIAFVISALVSEKEKKQLSYISQYDLCQQTPTMPSKIRLRISMSEKVSNSSLVKRRPTGGISSPMST